MVMEQYWMPKELDFENLRFCIDNYSPTFLYIRTRRGIIENGKHSVPGRTKVKEDLTDKTLNFRKTDSGLYMLVNSNVVFHFLLKKYYKGFSLAYERIEPTEDGIGRRVILSHEIDPYDPNFPEPRKSTLRIGLDDHLMEIDFEGRINIKFHSWSEKLGLKYWTIDNPSSN